MNKKRQNVTSNGFLAQRFTETKKKLVTTLPNMDESTRYLFNFKKSSQIEEKTYQEIQSQTKSQKDEQDSNLTILNQDMSIITNSQEDTLAISTQIQNSPIQESYELSPSKSVQSDVWPKKTLKEQFFEQHGFQIQNKFVQNVKHPQELLDCSYTPQKINFRLQEQEKIENFLINNIQQDTNVKCLLLTGNPGTGKTLLVQNILNEFQNIFQQKSEVIDAKKTGNNQQNFSRIGENSKFLKKISLSLNIIKVNGMRFKTFMEFFRNLWAEIFQGEQIEFGANFIQIVEDIQDECKVRWEKQQEKTILMIDEFDCLFSNKKESKQMFEIFSLSQHLILIGISNSMEMFQNLKDKFHVNEGKIILDKIENIVFQPYSHLDMAQIAHQRILEIKDQFELTQDIFTEKAIKFTSNVVYNKGGDIRVLLDVCKRALQKQISKIVKISCEDQDFYITPQQLQQVQPISIANLSNIVEEMYSSKKNIQIIQHLPRDIKFTLIAIYNMYVTDTSLIQIGIKDILNKTFEITNRLALQNLDMDSIGEHLRIRNSTLNKNIQSKKPNTSKHISINQMQIFLKINIGEIKRAVCTMQNDEQFLSSLIYQD